MAQSEEERNVRTEWRRKWKIFWTQCIVRLNLNLSKLSACSFPPVCNLCLSWFRWWWVRGWALVCAGRSARVKHSCWLFMRRSSRPSQVPPHLCSSEPVASCGCFKCHCHRTTGSKYSRPPLAYKHYSSKVWGSKDS